MRSRNVYFNPNPKKREVQDCVVRAICAMEEKGWDDVYKELCTIGLEEKALPDDKVVYQEYLRRQGFERVPISNKKGAKRPTVNVMASQFPSGAICEIANHLVTVKNGKILDLWDCGEKSLYGYWVKSREAGDQIPDAPSQNPPSHEEIIRFWFYPIESEDSKGTDIFVRMKMPNSRNEYNRRIKEVEDAISSYIDAVAAWSFESLVNAVTKSFDENAKTVKYGSAYNHVLEYCAETNCLQCEIGTYPTCPYLLYKKQGQSTLTTFYI